jgi:hypothetical protein
MKPRRTSEKTQDFLDSNVHTLGSARNIEKVSYHSTKVLDVQCHDNERIIIRQAAKSGRTCSLKEYCSFGVAIRYRSP